MLPAPVPLAPWRGMVSIETTVLFGLELALVAPAAPEVPCVDWSMLPAELPAMPPAVPVSPLPVPVLPAAPEEPEVPVLPWS
jgi:hypothetical protein